jgi:hypothetical protein
MTEYTSTREGFERAMKWSLTGPPEETYKYTEAMLEPSYTHTFNGKKQNYAEAQKMIEEMRPKAAKYDPKVYVLHPRCAVSR